MRRCVFHSLRVGSFVLMKLSQAAATEEAPKEEAAPAEAPAEAAPEAPKEEAEPVKETETAAPAAEASAAVAEEAKEEKVRCSHFVVMF